MSTRLIPTVALTAFAALACTAESNEPAAMDLEVRASAGAPVRTVAFPSEDPGPPLYVRVTPLLNQIFAHDGLVAIPFYRDPTCIPPETNLFAHFHPPGPGGPGAFGCALLVEGSYIIEADAALGTFPIRAHARGPAQVWIVTWEDFAAATADGQLTMAELLALEPLRGTASTFSEMLAPRMENHHVVITSRGTLEDGRTFQFNVNHTGDRTRSILLRIR